MNKKYDVILFDMDGTIANTDQMILETFQQLYDKFNNGVRKSDEEIYYFSGPPIKETLKKEFPNYDLDFMFNEFYTISKSMYDRTIVGFPYAREVILKLKEAGIKLGVVTNKVRGPAYYVLKLIDLADDIFDVVIGFDDVQVGKPSPEGINKALEYFNFTDKSRVLYIGDNAIDDTTAKNAGVDSCICYWGPRKMPEDLNPTYKIYDYRELLEKVFYE